MAIYIVLKSSVCVIIIIKNKKSSVILGSSSISFLWATLLSLDSLIVLGKHHIFYILLLSKLEKKTKNRD